MHDVDVRNAIHEQLLQKQHSDPNTLVLDEFGIEHGKQRIDIAIINGHIGAIEIKSQKDNLRRLPAQSAAYSKIADEAAIVVSENHLVGARALVPSWWGISVAVYTSNGNIIIREVRESSTNSDVDAYSVAQLLWRDEAANLLLEIGEAKKDIRKPRAELYQRLTEILPVESLCQIVRDKIKARDKWRGRGAPLQYGG